MTDCSNRLAGPIEGADQVDGRLVGPKMVGVTNPAREDDCVEIAFPRVLDRQVRSDGLAGIVVNRGLDGIQVGRRKLHLGAFAVQDLERPKELRFLEAIGRDDEHFRI